jgi:nicotinamide-nucleotide amidase
MVRPPIRGRIQQAGEPRRSREPDPEVGVKAQIMSVGTELLLGQIVDTNAAYLAQYLSGLGIDLYWQATVGDNLGRLTDELRRAWDRADLIVMTGGVGPTDDDLTREAIAALLGEAMTVQPDLEAHLRAWFGRRGQAMPERNVKQATLIPSAEALPNPIGTAPGWWVERDGHIVVAMPGVPVEMRKMWEEQAVPRLQSRLPEGGIILSRTLKCIGIGESAVEELVRPLIASTNPTLATYAKQDGVHLRLTAKAHSRAAAEAALAAFEPRVRALAGDYVYGVDDETLAQVVGDHLRRRGLTLATMESLTGGLLASQVTDVPGSSEYFRGGVVAYSADVKRQQGVPAAVIEAHGTVAAETSLAMATAARTALGADVALATTGVAGPRELEGKPPGTIYVALDFQGRTEVEQQRWRTTRSENKRRAVLAALNLLWRAVRT